MQSERDLLRGSESGRFDLQAGARLGLMASGPRPPLGRGTLILLDVPAPDLATCLGAVQAEVEARLSLPPAYAELVRAALRRHADAGPERLSPTVGLVHEQVTRATGPSVEVLVRIAERDDEHNGEQAGAGASAVQRGRFLWVLISNDAVHPRASAAVEFARLCLYEDFRAAVLAAATPADLAHTYARGLRDQLRYAHAPEGCVRTGRLFGGVRLDLARRLPWWVDDMRSGLDFRVLASCMFMFFACLAPAVAFGGLLATLTDGHIGAIETILASAVCGVLWSLLAGQPLAIVGATGPNVVFTGILFGLCLRFDVPFLPVVAWTGLWTGLFLLVLAATDASALIRYFTRFTDEIFAALIAMIFIAEAVKDVIDVFTDPTVPADAALLSLLLALGTFMVALNLSRWRQSPYLRRRVREFLSDFGPTIAIVLMSLLAFHMRDIKLEMLAVPESFRPSIERPWLVDPFAAPTWVWFACAVPALLLTLLIWVNQNITARLVQSPDHKLRKFGAYHWDIAVVGGLVALMGMFGLPWVVGAVVRSLSHVKSLVTIEDGEVVGVIENRLSNLGVHVLIGLSLLLLPLLQLVPMPVLYGVFLFMGVGSLRGNQFMERLRLWIMDPERYPATHYVRAVPAPVVHVYTAVQAAGLAVLWVVKSSGAGILFPFFIALLVPVRMRLARYFEPEHLALLDAREVPEDEEFRDFGV